MSMSRLSLMVASLALAFAASTAFAAPQAAAGSAPAKQLAAAAHDRLQQGGDGQDR